MQIGRERSVSFVHMAYAAYEVNQGVDYRYPFAADLIGGSHEGAVLYRWTKVGMPGDPPRRRAS
jgi:hypothetical protein